MPRAPQAEERSPSTLADPPYPFAAPATRSPTRSRPGPECLHRGHRETRIARGCDASTDASLEATALDNGPNFHVQGITDDGYVIYWTEGAVKAVPIDGGPPSSIVAVAAGTSYDMNGPWAAVLHNDVFILFNPNSGPPTLTLWSHALLPGAPNGTVLSSNTCPGTLGNGPSQFPFAVSPDSSVILYIDSSTSMAVSIADGQLGSAVPLVTDIGFPGGESPVMVITGAAPPYQALVAFTHPLGSIYYSPPSPLTLLAFSTSDWTSTQLATDATWFWSDDSGAWALVQRSSGELDSVSLSPTPSSSIVTLDPSSPDPVSDMGYAYLGATDDFVLYATQSGKLVTSPVDGATPTVLLDGGAGGWFAVSPDERWAMAIASPPPPRQASCC